MRRRIVSPGAACAVGRAARALALVLSSLSHAAAADVAGLPGDRVGGVEYGVYVPRDRAPSAPMAMILVLHGCRQSAADMRALTRFDPLADEQGFAVAYAQVEASPTNPLGCWTWWSPGNLGRGHGLAADLVAVVGRVGEAIALDTERVYVVGFSSGAAMALVAGILYPDVFAAAGIHSGLPFGSAGAWTCAAQVMEKGDDGAVARAADAFGAQGARHRVLPVMVFQGDADAIVAEENAEQIIAQLIALDDLADDGRGNGSFAPLPAIETAGQVIQGRDFLRADYPDAAGRAVLSLTVIRGMGHAWSGAPAGMEYGAPDGPDASARLWQFFRQWRLGDPPIREAPAAACEERNASNFTHYWWYRNMSFADYACDPWTTSWRRRFDADWHFGRCP